MTVTFHGEKVGLHVTPGAFHCGYDEVADIGLEPLETEHARVSRDLLDLVPHRGPGTTSTRPAHVLVVGGSRGLTGAPCLASLAAMRADAGYVTMAGPGSIVPVFEHWVLEAVKHPLPEDDEGRLVPEAVDTVLETSARAGAVALGPGLGRSAGTKEVVRRLLGELELPAVVDADALWELEPGDWPAPRVLTPHAGELARLLGEESALGRRPPAGGRCAARSSGSAASSCSRAQGTLVGAPGEGTLVCGGYPTLATAGTGDVLTGIIGAFLAKGMDARLAAAAAATAHTAAAIEAPQQAGLIAGDLLEALPGVLVG